MKKLAFLLWLLTSMAARAATEEQLHQQFTVQPGGRLVVDVDFGSVNVSTHAASEVVVDAWRSVTRSSKSAEEAFLEAHPVNFSQDGNTVAIRSRGSDQQRGWWSGRSRTEAKYTITVPAEFDAQLKTAGGGIAVSNLAGAVKAATSGGGLRFADLRGPLDGFTSGGGVHVTDCAGKLKIRTSGGGIDVRGGSGSLDGVTSGGSVTVKDFQGAARVGTSGGGLTIEKVGGEVSGSTSGGSISAALPSPLPGNVKLSTSGGGITVRIPEDAAFDLDAETSAGGVTSELPVAVVGKVERNRLKGPVNGGGKSVVLRTSAGGIRLKKP